PYYSLVMRFCISNCFFLIPPVHHHVPHFMDVPILVRFFFQITYPKVRNTHPQPEVKAYSTLQRWSTKPRHTTHFLSNGNGTSIYLLHQCRGQLKINNGIFVHITVEILVVMIKSNIAMVVI